jgi:nucleotidyltransferase/DNA polymerase involved in DNA repair
MNTLITPAQALGEILRILIVTSFFAGLVGYEIGRRRTVKKVEKKEEEHLQGLSDLKLIEGIGPKIEQILFKAGVETYHDLAKIKPAAIKKILVAENPRYHMHDTSTWVEQARLADLDHWDELDALKKKLKGGRKNKKP